MASSSPVQVNRFASSEALPGSPRTLATSDLLTSIESDLENHAVVDVTSLTCLEYLLAYQRGDVLATREAFDHLRAIMLRATKNVYIPESIIAEGNSIKFDFVEEFILEELFRWLARSPEAIKAAAETGAFRYLARRCRQRVLNKIRAIQRERQLGRAEAYQDKWYEHQPGERPRPLGPEEFDELLLACDFLDARNLNVVAALYEMRELSKGERTAALAKMFAVHVQTARKYIRELRKLVNAALKQGHSGAKGLADRLAAHISPAKSNGVRRELASQDRADADEFNLADLAEGARRFSWLRKQKRRGPT